MGEYWEKQCRPARMVEGDGMEVSGVFKIDPKEQEENADRVKVYSFKDFQNKYNDQYSNQEISEYWHNKCKEVKLTDKPTERTGIQFGGVFMDQLGSGYHDDLQ